MIVEHFNRPDTYAVWSKDKEIRFNSTSGGAFSEFAKIIISKGGIVVGAKYNESNMVEYAVAEDLSEIEKLRQSKYISSSLGDIYRETRKRLLEGMLVGFCGAPCQIAGLNSFLRNGYDKLITMDFICRGMNSPKAFKSWLSEIEYQENSRVVRVWFKYKEGGWKSSPRRTRLDFADGHYVVKDGEDNLFMHGYLNSNLYIRPCCGHCQFKGVPRKSDITFADFWGIKKEFDDDKGTSMLLINSPKGREFFEMAKNNMEVHKMDFDTIYDGNPMFSTSVVIPAEAKDFLSDLDSLSFSKAIKKYCCSRAKMSLWRKIAKSMRGFCKRRWIG